MLDSVMRRPRDLWTVTQTAQVTNERAAGITGATNPYKVNPYWTNVVFGVRVTAKVNVPLVAVRVYGLVFPDNANPGANFFPPAGAAAEALWTTVTDIGLNAGLVRLPTINDADAGNKYPVLLLPNFLLLEYSTGAPGATPTITFVVSCTFIGPTLGGTE